MSSCKLQVRWCPSQLMLADALTKDQWDPSELLRAALQLGEYQLNHEASVLEKKRVQRTQKPSKTYEPVPPGDQKNQQKPEK